MSDNSLPVIFHSTVVKREAVASRYPGGVVEFVRVLEPARSNADLFVLARMSLDDTDLVFCKLHAAGLVPGDDFGLYAMNNGTLIPCNGIRATVIELAPFVVNWSVHLDPAYVVQPEDVGYDWHPAGSESPEEAVGPEVAQVQEVESPLKVAGKPSSGPRRVVFRTGPVHWVYDDDEDED